MHKHWECSSSRKNNEKKLKKCNVETEKLDKQK